MSLVKSCSIHENPSTKQTFGAGIERGEHRVIDVAGEDDALARDAFGGERVAQE